MSQETKNSRKEIYDFLETQGIDLLPIRGQLRKLIMAYGKEQAQEIYEEVLILRDKVRKHRAIIKDLSRKV